MPRDRSLRGFRGQGTACRGSSPFRFPLWTQSRYNCFGSREKAGAGQGYVQIYTRGSKHLFLSDAIECDNLETIYRNRAQVGLN